MKTSDAREIKNRLSAYLRMVKQGGRVAITHRRRVVAELRRRVRAGTVRRGAPNRPDICPRPFRRLPSRIVQQLLDEMRGEW